MSDWNTDIKTAPFMKILEVTNEQMDEPCLATRGYISNGMVNGDLNLFTTVYTPRKYWATPGGNLCCPTKWRLKC